MRRVSLLALLVTSIIVLTGCAQSIDERRADVQATIESIEGVDVAQVSGFQVSIAADEGLSPEEASKVLRQVRAVVVELDDPIAPAYLTVGFSGPSDRRWLAEWRFGALSEDGFDQQADFVASLSQWNGINAADAPFSKIRLEVSEPDPDQFVSIQAYQMTGSTSDEVRADLLGLWVESGGDPDVYIHWRGRG
ncbi:hypothetical protein ACL9RL_17775 [Plantibacter sp. Mn2098]|uniref:hypothetical protein n=1 Tax=Plantibacter sp. Mn2098 TaxID=3395266 RepID=UPI003BD8D2F4